MQAETQAAAFLLITIKVARRLEGAVTPCLARNVLPRSVSTVRLVDQGRIDTNLIG